MSLTVNAVKHLLLSCCLLMLLCCAAVAQDGDLPAATIDFARDIQPILSENCYFCHGPDSENREAGLRLDMHDDALAVIEPGAADESELYRRIISDDADELMPPASSHRQLSEQQKQLLQRWIDQGANWAQHWAFVPLQQPNLPIGSPQPHPVDRFIVRRLQAEGLQLSPVADRRTLIRRVAIDLTGLPPTPEQIATFLADESDQAYERMVDRYLASPHFGERMAWNWLDAARYADSNGYQQDAERTAWPWRDWVVEAYNRNLPFDQFSTWQLAGDLIPDADQEQVLASAFLRNYPINGEGGRIAEENRVDYVMDMTETTGTVWLGLTLNCCRCHDHKYDQLSQREYYQLSAFFNQTPVTGAGGDPRTAPVLAVPNVDQKTKLAKFDQQLAELTQQLQRRRQSILAAQPAWEAKVLQQLDAGTDWQVVKAMEANAEHATLERQDDFSLLTTGPAASVDTYRLKFRLPVQLVNAVRLEVLPHASMTNGALSRSNSGNFVLTDVRLRWMSETGTETEVPIAAAQADFEQGGHPVAQAIDSDPKSGWAVYNPNGKMDVARYAVFQLESPLELPADAEVELVLAQQSIHDKHTIGRFRISVTADDLPALSTWDADTLAALRIDPESRDQQQQQLVRDAYFGTDEKLQEAQRQTARLREQRTSLERQVPAVMVMGERDQPRKTFILSRGSYRDPGEPVTAEVPAILPSLSADETVNRLALANWMFDPDHPLTARVAVNRLWAQVFGVGLVKTSEDFGVQGQPPTHPELLDWLACHYRDSGWDTKALLRLILTSQSYRQTAKVSARSMELDPENRLLSRAPRYRMPSWMIRDYALAASGRLVRRLGGPPVNPYQPPGVWEEASFDTKKFTLGTGDQLYRRSLYTFWRRIAPPTLFFDSADRMSCSVNVQRTNTPLHALTTLNDVTFVEASRLLATETLLAEVGQDADRERLDRVFERLLARATDQQEQRVLLAALQRTRQQFAADPQATQELLSVGQTPAESSLDPVELASWTSLCLAVLNLDETLTRQ